MIDYTPDIIENRGVPVEILTLDDQGNETGAEHFTVRFRTLELLRVEQLYSGHKVIRMEPEKKFSTKTVTKPNGEVELVPFSQLTGKQVAVEHTLYGVEALSVASESDPWSTIIRIFNVVRGVERPDSPDEVEWMARRLRVGDQGVYLAAINNALSLAQGMDPTVAAASMASSVAAAAAEKRLREASTREVTSQAVEALARAEEMIDDLVRAQAAQPASSPGEAGSEPGSEPDEPSTPS